MYHGRDESWNLRDTHMFQTLNRLLKHRSRGGARPAKAIVWAHNSHVGDARATSMGWTRGELNIGQLCKEMHGPGAPGKAGGALSTGRILDYLDKGDDNRRACSLYLSLMDMVGVKLDRFGDAEKRLEGLQMTT